MEHSLEGGTLYVFHSGPSAPVLIDGYVVSRYSDAVQEQKLGPAHVRKGRGPPCWIAGILYFERVSAEGEGANAR